MILRSIMTAAMLLSACTVACAQDLVAIVDLKFIKETDRTAEVMCYGDRDEDCGVWATHNLYKATIRKVISGSESRKTMLVLYGRHAMRDIDLPRVIATMRRLGADDEFGAQYQVLELGEKRELLCFPRSEDDTQGLELKDAGERAQTCFDAKRRDEEDG